MKQFTYKSPFFFFTHLNYYHFLFRLAGKTSVILMWIFHMLPQTSFITQVKATSQTQEMVERCPTQSVHCYHFASLSPRIWANTIQTSSLKPTMIASQNWRLNFSVTKNKEKRHSTGSSVLWLFKRSDRKSSWRLSLRMSVNSLRKTAPWLWSPHT